MFKRGKFVRLILVAIVLAEKLDEGVYRSYLWLQLLANQLWRSIIWNTLTVVMLVVLTATFYDRAASLSNHSPWFSWLCIASLIGTVVAVWRTLDLIFSNEHNSSVTEIG